MVKRRVPNIASISVEKRIEEFASEADQLITSKDEMNSEAPRDYKAIRVPFNQYEYELLENLCKKTKRSKLNMIRYALEYYNKHNI
ncbi:hypothetical protein [Arsenophonus nasoniae]|uniref:Ribbon-helix-helix protein CopG domain-containing protein n=1 Tax=Arsenophonus nasoniae TaxID=638 RepID=A0AA95G8C2_9GAMM|nr:hypothetical protein [Arsenophonus nasoniae]WGL94071.1 hypothetical protein QE207_01855 [Arsenophonus nasoniae]